MRRWHVAVIGCGTAGAAAALFLARLGHEVTLLERVVDPQPVGAGITLQPTGQAVLGRLGLQAAVLARGTRVDRLWVRRRDGKTVIDLRYRDVAPELFGVGLHRGVLFTTLLDAVRAQTGIALRFGVSVTGCPRAGTARTVVTASGETLGPFDLVVVGAGGSSDLHADAGIPRRVRPYPWGALWFVARDPGRVFTGDITQWVEGARHMCGLLPTGRSPHDDTELTSLFWSIRADRVAAWRAAGIDAWKADVLRFEARAGFVLDQVTDASQVLFTQYRDVAMPRWHGERIVFLGDAAHATSPQLGQGANLALWDAMVLGDCLATGADLGEALAAYTEARRRHLGYYQFATRALTPFFQSDSRLLGWLRDLVFPLSGPWTGLRRRMVRTMCGIDTGIVRRPLELRSG